MEIIMLIRMKKAVPCIFLAILTGIGTGGLVFLFRGIASIAGDLSEKLFALARENFIFIPVLIVGAALLGAAASFILKYEPNVSGGGIPTSIAVLRGIITFRWIRLIFTAFSSSFLTYVSGVPLGTEGPCVLLGTAVGHGTSIVAGKYEDAVDRYSMTGGACAGFAAATGAPLCGILFAVEEAHKKITPTLLVMSAVSVFTGVCTCDLLSFLTAGTHSMFELPVMDTLRFTSLWFPLVIGVVCGLAAAGFTVLHTLFGKLLKSKTDKIPLALKLASVFALCGAAGCFTGSFTGTGHHLIEELLTGSKALWVLAVILLVRCALFIVANNARVTGGTFIPCLAIGALLGMICAVIGDKAGIVDVRLTATAVTLGMSAFISAVSKTPLMAIAFGIEALGGGTNIPSFVLASVAAYVVMELLGLKEFVDVAVEGITHAKVKRDKVKEYACNVKIADGSFADGMERGDLILPYGCRITHGPNMLSAGDSVTVSCSTDCPEYVKERLFAVFGTEVTLAEVSFAKKMT